MTLIGRAIALMGLLNKKGVVYAMVRDAFGRAWDAARDGAHYFPFAELAEAGMPVGLITIDVVAAEAEALAARAATDTYPRRLNGCGCWRLAVTAGPAERKTRIVAGSRQPNRR